MTFNAGEVVPAFIGIPVPRTGDLDAFTDGWLANRRLSDHTRLAYRRDVGDWLDWCRHHDLDPLVATFIHVNGYARELEARPLTPTTVARKLSGLSSWYGFLLKIGGVSANPVGGADRPRVGRDHSATVGLAATEVDALLGAAEADPGPARARNHAVIAVLADLGLRVGEVVGLNLDDLGYERGHRSIRFTGKGGAPRRRALTPASTAAVETYLMTRAAAAGVPVDQLTGALFVTTSGARIDRHAVFRLIRRLATDAGIPTAPKLSPHSLRHAFATAAREEGVPLEDVQDAMGHADPRTTRRYDRDRHNLDRDPSYAIWAARARRRTGACATGMATTVDDDELRRARVGAQLLHRPDRRPAVADLVGRLLAIQAQDLSAAPLALRARSQGLVAADVHAAREDRSVVRAWGPRGTLHFIAADDLGWLTALHWQLLNGSLRRLGQLGVSGTAESLLRRLDHALDGQGPLSKVELGRRLGLTGQAIVHMASLGASRGRLILGPDQNRKATYVYVADWLGQPLDLSVDRPKAMAELARRYLRSHGPAAPDDLANWSGLALGECRTAFTAIGSHLTEVRHHDRPLWKLRRSGRAAPMKVALLPAFDDYLLGWKDRSLIVEAEHARTVVPGGGIVRAAVVADGRVVGTWRTGHVDTFAPCDASAIKAEQADIARFTG